MNCKTVRKQIICIKQNTSKMPLHIIIKQPAIETMIVIYFLFIFLTAGWLAEYCKILKFHYEVSD